MFSTSSLKTICALFVLLLLAVPSTIFAVTLASGNSYSYVKLKKKVLEKVPELSSEQRLLRGEAKTRKMQMAFEYDEMFEEHKAKIRRLGEQISQLAELEDNFKNIDYLKQQKVLKTRILANKIEDFRVSYAGVYIPVVVAGYIEVPSDKDAAKEGILHNFLSKQVMEEFGIDRVWSEKIIQDNTLVNEDIITRRIGTIELDGTKGFDRNFLNYTPEGTRFLSIYFFRFKPFDAVDKEALKNKETGDKSNGLGPNSIEHWNLSQPASVLRLKSFIAKQFPDEAVSYQKELETYIGSLKNLDGRIEKGKERAEEVIARLNRILLKSQSDMAFIDKNIRQLENQNSTIISSFDPADNVSEHNVIALKDQLITKKKELENAFEYSFILMGESSASSYEQSMKNAINEMFDKLKSLSQKKSIDITTTVSSGVVTNGEAAVSNFEESFSNVTIYPYVAGSKVGALMSVSVRYDRASDRHRGGNTRSSDVVQSSNLKGSDFVESAAGLNINLKFIKEPGNASNYFFISKMPVTKKQFLKFSDKLGNYMGQQCLSRLGDDEYYVQYPEHFPLLCVNSDGQSAFVEWLQRTTGKAYKLPEAKQQQLAGAYGLTDSSSDVFRVVLEQ